jgi:hypothetical protein
VCRPVGESRAYGWAPVVSTLSSRAQPLLRIHNGPQLWKFGSRGEAKPLSAERAIMVVCARERDATSMAWQPAPNASVAMTTAQGTSRKELKACDTFNFSLAVSVIKRQWKKQVGPALKTASGNLFPLAVILTQPPVEIGCFHWRLCNTNRQWKLISTGGYLNLTASGNILFPLAVVLR